MIDHSLDKSTPPLSKGCDRDVDNNLLNDSNIPSPKRKSAPLKTKDKALSSSLMSSYSLTPSLMKDTLGRYRIQSLFEGKAQSIVDSPCPVFSLDDYKPSKYPSFKRMYIEIGDPSEYRMAMELLGSWEHWTRLADSPWFKPYLQECREELNAKIRSVSIAKITEDGKGAFSEATRLAANKFLATGAYMVEAEKEVVKEVAKRGRPSKEEIQRRTKEILTEEGSVVADYARIMEGATIGKA